MARPRQVDLELVCQAQVIAKEALKAGDLQAFCRALAVLLPELAGCVAGADGVGVVRRAGNGATTASATASAMC